MATKAAELIADAKGYTGTLLNSAESSLSTAIDAVQSLGYTEVTFAPLTLPAQPLAAAHLTPPTLSDVPLDLPAAPTQVLVFQDIAAITPGTMPNLTAAVPVVSMPNQPSQLTQFTSTLPSVDLSAQLPAAPSLIMPEAPTMPVRTEPTAPTTLLPSFGGVMPSGLPTAPSDLAGSLSSAYHAAAPEFITMINGYVDAELTKLNPQYHGQMAAIETQLTRYLQGGTGLAANVEKAIFDRARERNDSEAKRLADAAYNEAAGRGFTFPTGALSSIAQRARQDAVNNNNKTTGEIVVMQAEMEQKNLQFAVTTSVGLRTAMVNASLSYMQNITQLNGQALDYAKSVMGAIVEMYNTSVRVFTARLEAYKTEAVVFETLMRGALAGIEVYKAEISALQALTQVDHTRVEVYKARIDVLTSMSNMYRTQVDAVVSKASLEKLKIDVFQAQVQAYGAQVQAKNAEWQGYSAAIGGETAKVNIYGAQVQAYGQQVQAYRADIDAKSEVVRATATSNDARARQYTATMQGYQTVVQAKGEMARTKLENQRQQVVAFQAETQAAIGNAQVQNEFYKATSMVGIENAKLTINAMIQSAELKRGYAQSLAQLHTANATIHANLAGAAMSGMNSLAVESAAS